MNFSLKITVTYRKDVNRKRRNKEINMRKVKGKEKY